jgi:hypothetical protein
MLTGIFYAVALQSMHYEFVISFVTVVRHLTADPLFPLVVQNRTPQLTVSAVTVNYTRDSVIAFFDQQHESKNPAGIPSLCYRCMNHAKIIQGPVVCHDSRKVLILSRPPVCSTVHVDGSSI